MTTPTPESRPSERAVRQPRLARAAFVLYALALVTATHWPALVIEMPVFTRVDLVVHAGAFGCWTVLFTLAGFFGRPLSTRNIQRSAAIAICYSTVDELSQAIPAIRRSVDATDLAANWTGIVLAALALLMWARVRAKGSTGR